MLENNEKQLKLKKKSDLNDHLVYKLNEIVEFCDSYSSNESFEIPNLTEKQAQLLNK